MKGGGGGNISAHLAYHLCIESNKVYIHVQLINKLKFNNADMILNLPGLLFIYLFICKGKKSCLFLFNQAEYQNW